MIYTATVTQKGQVTLPVEIRNMLGIKPYEKVTFIKHKDEILLKPAKSFLDLKGSVKTTKKLSNEEIDKTVSDYVGNEYVKK